MRRFIRILLLVLLYVNIFYPAEVEVKEIFSEVMNKKIPAAVIIPQSYKINKKPFSVIYLLHGFGGNYRNWLDLTSIEDYTDRYDIIIVCPEGGFDSWYFDSPEDPQSQYETHIAVEVVNFIDSNYRTNKSRYGRAITGLSMGGHGALFLAMRHKDTFGAAGSMSGGVDIRTSTKKFNISHKIGSIEDHPERWDSLTVVNNISKIKNAELAIITDCGVDDFFLDVNHDLHNKLIAAGVPHEYIERPGGHNWDYWGNAIKYQLFFFNEFFNGMESEEKE